MSDDTSTAAKFGFPPAAANLFNFDFNKILSDFKMPGIDLESVMATQRKNIEALTRANQVAFEGVQAVARRQTEILRSGFEEASSAMREVVQTQSPQERVAKQADIAKKSVETAISNARELAEILAKAQSEAFDVLKTRMGENFDEVKGLIKK